jgi:sugar phosphate isomerase/epimerase
MRMNGSEYFRGVAVAEYFRSLPCPLIELHLHDNSGEKDDHGHFGFGTVPIDEVAKALKDMKFDGVCTIEIVPAFHGSTPEESKDRAVESLNLWRSLIQLDQ